MKIPYGVSNFADLRRGGFFYVDKTPFLPVLESGESGFVHLLFLRPRRMGKSLLLSMMEHYYDVGRSEEFDELFGGLWIHEHPTPERNRYLVLTLDFSALSAGGAQDDLQHNFLEALKNSISYFLGCYRTRVPDLARLEEHLDAYEDAAALIGRLLATIAGAGQKLYLLIDEYDNFANRLLSDGAQNLYESVVQRTGFVRSFFATLKTGTRNGAIGRMFITGISPILLDDLSSGFNIVSHVSRSPQLNALTGFTRAEVERAVDEFLAARPHLAGQPEIADRTWLLDTLASYYDGYRFSEDAGERVFNSDMVLYFLREMNDRRRYPSEMLDLNVRTDYQRLLRISMLTGTSGAARRALLEEALSNGYVYGKLVQQFGAGSLSSREQFVSLLYYLGMLTIGTEPQTLQGHRLEIPNRVIRDLQWEHLAFTLRDEAHIEVETHELATALEAMAVRGDIAPFLELFRTRVLEAIGVKDLRQFNEKALKLMLLTYLSQSRAFYVLSEKELAQGYCDLFLAASRLMPSARYAWLLELKYLPTTAKPAQIEAAFAAAEQQVARYMKDAALLPLLTDGKELKAGSLVFRGAKEILFRPWPAEGPRREARPRRAGAPAKTASGRGTTKKAAKKKAR